MFWLSHLPAVVAKICMWPHFLPDAVLWNPSSFYHQPTNSIGKICCSHYNASPTLVPHANLHVSSVGVPLTVNCSYCRCGDKLFTGAVWPWFCVLWAWISVDSSALWSNFSCWTLGKWMLSGAATRSSLSFWNFLTDVTLPSVLWYCWLGIRKSIQPAKNLLMKCWCGYLFWSEVQILCMWSSWCHCTPSSLASLKSRMVLPFWCWLTQIVLEKRPLNQCLSVNWCYFVLQFCIDTLEQVATVTSCVRRPTQLPTLSRIGNER